jgi:hypothetical protein
MVDDGMFCMMLLTKVSVGRLLLEDSFNILQEDGFKVLLEA